jgi:hypothetical protein
MTRRVTVAERRRRLAVRHHLDAPGPSLERVAEGLLGYHASDPASVYLAALARRPTLTIGEMEDALYERRSLLKILGMRRTMFAVPPMLATTIDAACTRALSAVQHRRLARLVEGAGVAVDGHAWIASATEKTLENLRSHGEGTAREMATRVPELSPRVLMGENSVWATEVGLASRLLFLLAVDGKIIRARPLGTWLSSQYRWAAFDEWSPGTLQAMEAPAARAALIARWLRSYGPGTMEDLAWWSGLSRRSVADALVAAGAIEVHLEDGIGWLMPDDLDEASAVREPWVALLPALDSTTMGWRRRSWYLDPAIAPRLFDVNGNAGPTVWASGRVVGGWGQRRDGTVAFALLDTVTTATRSLIDARANQLTEWLGGLVVTPRFRTPLEREIAVG